LTYVLDTNIFIAGLNGNAAVLRRLDVLHPEDIVLCARHRLELPGAATRSFKPNALGSFTKHSKVPSIV